MERAARKASRALVPSLFFFFLNLNLQSCSRGRVDALWLHSSRLVNAVYLGCSLQFLSRCSRSARLEPPRFPRALCTNRYVYKMLPGMIGSSDRERLLTKLNLIA